MTELLPQYRAALEKIAGVELVKADTATQATNITSLQTNVTKITADQEMFENLFNKATITTGVYLGSSGAPVDASGYCYSDFIKIDPSLPLSFYGAFNITFQLVCYDANKAFLGTVNTSDCSGIYHDYKVTINTLALTKTALVGTVYVRANTTTTAADTAYMMVQSEVYPSEYTPYGFKSMVEGIKKVVTNKLYLKTNPTTAPSGKGVQQKITWGKDSWGVADLGQISIGNGAGSKLKGGTGDEGYFNTFVGTRAGADATTADHVSLFGYQAGNKLTTGKYITALGEDAYYGGTIGERITASGCRAMQNPANNVGDNDNTCHGALAFYNAFDATKKFAGKQNCAFGSYAGSSHTGGDNCIYIGYFANIDTATITTADNAVCIGANSKITKSNQIRLGNTSMAVVDTYADIEILTAGRGVIFAATDGSTTRRYKVTVDFAGQLTTTLVA